MDYCGKLIKIDDLGVPLFLETPVYTHYTVDLNDLVDKGENPDKHPKQLPSPFLPQDVELLMQDPT